MKKLKVVDSKIEIYVDDMFLNLIICKIISFFFMKLIFFTLEIECSYYWWEQG